MQLTTGSAGKLNKRTVKKAIYIFIAVVLFLTFFSSTLNNITLPRVKGGKPENGILLKRIEEEGTVEAKASFELFSDTALMVRDIKASSGQI